MAVPDAAASSRREPAAWEPIVGAIGPKVRAARQQLGLSLQQLAGRAEVSAAAIHKVERGDMVPTVTTLLKLAGALGHPITHFVDDAGIVAPVAVHVRAAGRPAAPQDWASGTRGVDAAGLTAAGGRLRGHAVLGVVEPDGCSGQIRPPRPGEELLLVLEGALVVDVAGERHRVEAGDTLHYPTDRPREWRNPGPGPARVIWWMLHG